MVARLTTGAQIEVHVTIVGSQRVSYIRGVVTSNAVHPVADK